MSPTENSLQRAVGYVRVSTLDQANEGVSLDAQRDRIAAWCLAGNLDLVEMATDAGISGSRTDNRPALQQAIDRVCKERGVLVVYSLSRLGRSTSDILALAAKLDRCGANLVSLTEKIDTTSAAGKMVFRILAVISEFERDLVVERTKTAMAHLRSQRRRTSRFLPYGYDIDQNSDRLVPSVREQAVLKRIREWRQTGRSYDRIAKMLNEDQTPSKTGVGWSAKTVRGVWLRNVNG